MKRVIFDARMWSHTGIGTYVRQLLKHMNFSRDYEWTLLGNEKMKSVFKEIPQNVSIRNGKSSIYSFAEQFELTRESKGHDLIHVPHYNAPMWGKTPLVVTVHDLTHFRFGKAYGGPMKLAAARTLMKSVIKKAKRIIAISQATSQDLQSLFGADERKIRVVTEGPGELLSKIDRKEGRLNTDLPDKYILYVGNLKPHKNVESLLDAFLSLKKEDIPEKLVVVGKFDEKSIYSQKLKLLMNANEDRIVHMPSVTPDELLAIYQESNGLIAPSLWEGFGLSLLEAFQCGIPVACSNIPSHREIAGDGGLYFDPSSKEEIKKAIKRLSEDASLKERLVRNGKERLGKFSWEKCARDTLKVYQEVLDETS